ncbi:aspartic peptidase domain-containing protein [Abortiporus biennis]|nr:aspartic peptidase domain-containing protein [Abortiporus biennis]
MQESKYQPQTFIDSMFFWLLLSLWDVLKAGAICDVCSDSRQKRVSLVLKNCLACLEVTFISEIGGLHGKDFAEHDDVATMNITATSVHKNRLGSRIEVSAIPSLSFHFASLTMLVVEAFIICSLSLLIQLSTAIRFPVRRADSTSQHTNASGPFAFSQSNLIFDDGFIIYTAELEIDGSVVKVVLDTGSSDLWVDPVASHIKLPNVVDTGHRGAYPYGEGTVAEGPIITSTVKFGNFTVQNQALINAAGSNVTLVDVNRTALLGLGPPFGSVIGPELKNTSFSGKSLLENIFASDPDLPNVLTMQLSRSPFATSDGGIFTIGEIDPNFQNIVNETKLDALLMEFPVWATLMDGVKINGTLYNGHGLLENITTGAAQEQLITVIDSGSATANIPPFYVDAIYSNIPGAEPIDGGYIIPCNTKLNVSMVFAGKEYPMNPLDLIRLLPDDDNSTVACVNSITGSTLNPNVDAILGDIFMRNVYTLYNFGNFTTPGNAQPYMQLLSTTNLDDAFKNFDSYQTIRLDILNKTLAARNASAHLAIASGDDADQDSGEEVEHLRHLLKTLYIVVGIVGGVAIILLTSLVVTLGIILKNGLKGKGRYKAVQNSNFRDEFDQKRLYNPHEPYGS